MSLQNSDKGEQSTAKAISDLFECFKAIQAESKALKRKAAQSGNNSQPGTQDSVIVPGEEPPPSKKQRKSTMMLKKKAKTGH